MKSYLSGNPEIRLALNEDLSIGKDGASVYGMFYIFLVKKHMDRNERI